MSDRPRHFKCAICKGTFEKGRNEGDALNEAKELFGLSPDECDEDCLTCEDCWQMQMDQDTLLRIAFKYYDTRKQIPPSIREYLHRFKDMA